MRYSPVLPTLVRWLGLGLLCWKALEQDTVIGMFQLLLYRRFFQRGRPKRAEACRSALDLDLMM